MNSEKYTSGVLQSASRLFGWTLLVGGLALSLLADSVSGIGSLSESLQGLGFPAGTLCVAGFLLLALGSVKTQEPKQTAPSNRQGSLGSHREAPSMPRTQDLKSLEDRLIAELNQRHEDLRQELNDVSALLEANLDAGSLTTELSMAAGAELTPLRLPPAPRKLGPRRQTSPFTRDEEDEELEVFVELEDKEPDETLLWSQGPDFLDSGDLEDRLTGEVIADFQPFAWDAPSAEHSVDMEDRSPSVDLAAPQSTPIIEDEPQIDRSDIQWFDWDEDDLL